jgi:hypothetical protein
VSVAGVENVGRLLAYARDSQVEAEVREIEARMVLAERLDLLEHERRWDSAWFVWAHERGKREGRR